MKSYCICLCLSDLFYSTWYPQVLSVLLQMTRFLFLFLWLNSTPLCVCVYLTSSLSICGNLSGFHILTVVISAAMNIGAHMYFWISVFVFFLVSTQKWHLMNHMAVLFLIFRGNSILPSLLIAPVHIIIKCAQGFPFLYHLINACYFLIFLLIIAIQR